MTLNQTIKQIIKQEEKIQKLSIELNKTQKTSTEIKLKEEKEILYHLEHISSILMRQNSINA